MRSRSLPVRVSRRRRPRACSSSRATLTTADPAFRATVQRVLTKLRAMPQVTNLRTGAAGQVSQDRHAQLIEFDMKGSQDTADERVQPLLDAVAGLQDGEPWVHGGRVRLCERDARVEQDDRQGLPEGGEAVGADHVPDPAARVRRVRRGRRAGAARLLGRARARSACRRSPATSSTPRRRPSR